MPLPSPQVSPSGPPWTAPVRDARVGLRFDLDELLNFATGVLTACGVPAGRARTAAEALVHGDVAGTESHGLANLTRTYLPLFDEGRADPAAEPVRGTDLGAAVRVDARRGLGLWVAAEAMDLAVERAGRFGVGMVSVHGATHFGCAGFPALRAARHGMVGLVASNCGGQRIARPPGGRVTMPGANPLAVAAPAGPHHPFLLDMSTTAAPTDRVRAAARAGLPAPEGRLADDAGRPLTDPAAFDEGGAHPRRPGGTPAAGLFTGYGLGLAVEVLAGLVSGSALGPGPAAPDGDGRPSGRDDDIGFFVAAVAPALLRPQEDWAADAGTLFGSLLDCPPSGDSPVGYPGWPEGERARACLTEGVPVDVRQYRELIGVADRFGLVAPLPLDGAR